MIWPLKSSTGNDRNVCIFLDLLMLGFCQEYPMSKLQAAMMSPFFSTDDITFFSCIIDLGYYNFHLCYIFIELSCMVIDDPSMASSFLFSTYITFSHCYTPFTHNHPATCLFPPYTKCILNCLFLLSSNIWKNMNFREVLSPHNSPRDADNIFFLKSEIVNVL